MASRSIDRYFALLLAALAVLLIALFPDAVANAWTVFAGLVPLIVAWQAWQISRLERRVAELEEALRQRPSRD